MSHAAHNSSKKQPLLTARLNGRRAWNMGKTLDDCPYPDKRQSTGKLTWSRTYRNAWVAGWRDAEAGVT